MHAAFRRGGRAAINKVMKTQPAAFLKLLVLLVPREMKIEHSGGATLWGALATCVLGALAYDIAYWLDGW